MESETVHLRLLFPHLSCKINTYCLSTCIVPLNLDVLVMHTISGSVLSIVAETIVNSSGETRICL